MPRWRLAKDRYLEVDKWAKLFLCPNNDMGTAERVAERYKVAAGLRTRIDIKVDGWQGKQTVPPQQLSAFSKDLKAAIPTAGFVPAQGQLVQIDKSDLPKLDNVLKKHGLRIGQTPQQARYPYYDIIPPKGRTRHRVPPSRVNWQP